MSNLGRGPPIAHTTLHLRRPSELTVRGSVDAAGFKAAFSCAERPAAGRFRGAGRPLRLTVKAIGPWHRRLTWLRTTVSPVNIKLTCQARRPGIHSDSHLRLDA